MSLAEILARPARVVLRPMSIDDAPRLYEGFSDPEVMRYFPALLTPGQSLASIDFWRAQFAERGWSNWAAELKESGDFIGFVGLSVCDHA